MSVLDILYFRCLNLSFSQGKRLLCISIVFIRFPPCLFQEKHGAANRKQAQKGGAGSAGRSEEARKEAARKAARTRAERYGASSP